MIRHLLAATVAAMLICSTVACSLADADRKVNFYSPAEEAQMGSDAYKDVLAKEKRCTDAEANALVARVGKRLAARSIFRSMPTARCRSTLNSAASGRSARKWSSRPT